jgi:uroporphyrinogen decarboxylase
MLGHLTAGVPHRNHGAMAQTMSALENFRLLASGERPAWIPFTLDVGGSEGFTTAIQQRFQRETGATDPAEYFDCDFRLASIPRRYAGDSGHQGAEVPPGTQFDEWGIGHWAGGAEDTYERMFPPFARFSTIGEVERYPEPVLDLGVIDRAVRSFHSRGYPVIGYAGSIYEWSWWLRGMEQFMVDLLQEPGLAAAIIAKVSGFTARLALESARAGIDVLAFYDDAGSQSGMQISPAIWRSLVKPAWKRVLDQVRREAPSAVFFLHSCGNITEIVPDIAEVGFQILHPVQPECMDPAAVKASWGGKLILCATLGAQKTLSLASAQEVRRETARLAKTLGADRRCILCPSNRIQPETPWENVVAFVEEARAASGRGSR